MHTFSNWSKQIGHRSDSLMTVSLLQLQPCGAGLAWLQRPETSEQQSDAARRGIGIGIELRAVLGRATTEELRKAKCDGNSADTCAVI